MINRIYLSELQLKKLTCQIPRPYFLDLHFSKWDGFVKTQIYDKGNEMVMFPARHPMAFIFLNLFDLLECPVLLMTLILVIRFDNNTTKLLRQGLRLNDGTILNLT